MKSEHRHELQTNDLEKYAEQSVGFFKTYGNQLMIAVCLVSIVASAMIYWQRVSSTRLEQAWSDLAFATQPSEYQFIVSDPSLSKTPVAPWARLQESDGRLQEGIRLMFTERERALTEIKAARNGYQDLIGQSGVDPLIRERAMFGYARTLETLSDGKLENAITAYEDLLKEYPNTVYKPSVERQVAALRRGAASSFYAWFSQQKPTTTAPPKMPADKGRAGGKKGALKDDPTIEVPEARTPDLPILEAPTQDESKKDGKKESSEKTPAKAGDPARAALPKLEAPKTTAPAKEPAVKGPAIPEASSTPAPAKTTPPSETKAELKSSDAKSPASQKAADPAKKADDKKGS